MGAKTNAEVKEELKVLQNLMEKPKTSANDDIAKISKVSVDKQSLKPAKPPGNEVKDVSIRTHADKVSRSESSRKRTSVQDKDEFIEMKWKDKSKLAKCEPKMVFDIATAAEFTLRVLIPLPR